MTVPLRVQRQRTSGATHPPGTVFVDRSTRHGNPFEVRPEFGRTSLLWSVQVRGHRRTFQTKREAHAYAVAVFPESCRGREVAIMKNLRGQHLGCWCELCPEHALGKPLGEPCEACMPCHADPLGRIANGPLVCEPVPEAAHG